MPVYKADAQIRKGDAGGNGSIYFSAGYGLNWFLNKPDIYIKQPSLGSEYHLLPVKSDSKGSGKSIFPAQLRYRLGYYFNYDQTYGVEVSYDPVVYHITNNSDVLQKGTINNAPVDAVMTFASDSGYYYCMSGANLLMLNFVRRYGVYRNSSNNVRVDILAKFGGGPVMPGTVSNLDSNGFSDRQFQIRGWNAGIEVGPRITLFRYGYLEFTAKYNYASYNNIKVHQGTASQTLSTLQVLGSLGFTLPTSRFNPLFHHERKLLTIIPIFMQKRDTSYHPEDELPDSLAYGQDIPEFRNVLEKERKWIEKNTPKPPVDSVTFTTTTDSLGNTIITDSQGNITIKDSLGNIIGSGNFPMVAEDSTETKKQRRKRRRNKEATEQVAPPVVDSAGNVIVDTSGTIIPEFKETKKSKRKKKQEQQVIVTEAVVAADTAMKAAEDNSGNQKRKKKKKNKEEQIIAPEVPVIDAPVVAPPAPAPAPTPVVENAAPVENAEQPLSPKELKKKQKEAEKERKRKEKEEQKNKEAEEAKQKAQAAQAEEKAKEAAAKEAKQKAEAEEKERKKKEKEDEKARKKKEKEDEKERKKKEKEQAKESTEQKAPEEKKEGGQ